jgi:hypothetical protein
MIVGALAGVAARRDRKDARLSDCRRLSRIRQPTSCAGYSKGRTGAII